MSFRENVVGNMTIDLSSLNLIEKFIVEHGSATVQGVHINLLREQLCALDREVVKLKAEVAHLKASNEDLKAQLQRAQPSGLILHEGLLWKRTETGFEPRPYCPECPTHPVMMAIPPGEADTWACSGHHCFDYAIKPPTL
jgi:hypothetical protein